MPHIFIDGDGCPVKDETYRVADRYQLGVTVVANKPMTVPGKVKMIVVRSGHLDAADDWIAEHAETNDIVITADIPLADRCLKKGARVLGTTGEEFTHDNVGDFLATRELMQTLRQTGEARGGPPPMDKRDRSRFLGKLDQIVQALKRG
ncbi:MAG: YaiI/YqxD family protein [Bdellovibrionota bacterium]